MLKYLTYLSFPFQDHMCFLITFKCSILDLGSWIKWNNSELLVDDEAEVQQGSFCFPQRMSD